MGMSLSSLIFAVVMTQLGSPSYGERGQKVGCLSLWERSCRKGLVQIFWRKEGMEWRRPFLSSGRMLCQALGQESSFMMHDSWQERGRMGRLLKVPSSSEDTAFLC